MLLCVSYRDKLLWLDGVCDNMLFISFHFQLYKPGLVIVTQGMDGSNSECMVYGTRFLLLHFPCRCWWLWGKTNTRTRNLTTLANIALSFPLPSVRAFSHDKKNDPSSFHFIVRSHSGDSLTWDKGVVIVGTLTISVSVDTQTFSSLFPNGRDECVLEKDGECF